MKRSTGIISRGMLIFTLGWIANAPVVMASQPFEARLVTELSKHEVHRGQLFHAGKLLVGAIGYAQDKPYYELMIFSADGRQKLQNIRFPHSISHIVPMGSNKVVISGRTTNPMRSYYSIVDLTSARAQVRHQVLPPNYLVDHVAGDERQLYFSEMGDRTVYRWAQGRMQSIGTVSNAGMMHWDGQNLLILERRDFRPGDERVLRWNSGTRRLEVLYSGKVAENLVQLQVYGNHIVLTDHDEGQVILLSKTTGAVEHRVEIGKSVYGLKAQGRCLIAVTDHPRGLHFVASHQGQFAKVGEWDLDQLDDRLKQPRGIDVNPLTGAVYLRSTYPCQSCIQTQSSAFIIEDTQDLIKNACG